MSKRCLVPYLCELSRIDKNAKIILHRDLPLRGISSLDSQRNYKGQREEREEKEERTGEKGARKSGKRRGKNSIPSELTRGDFHKGESNV